MIKKGTKLYSIRHNKCPRCQQGDFWPTTNPYENFLFNSGAIFDKCSECGLKYAREVGFWYGAMYVTYGLGVAIFVTLWIITELILPENSSIWLQISVIVAAILLLAPVSYFYSRLIWINLFVSYEQDQSKIKKPKDKPIIIKK